VCWSKMKGVAKGRETERARACVCGVCVCGFGRQDVADTLACCACYEDALFEECGIAIRAGRGCHIVPQKHSSVRVRGWGQR
jgi:hypothetical protein